MGEEKVNFCIVTKQTEARFKSHNLCNRFCNLLTVAPIKHAGMLLTRGVELFSDQVFRDAWQNGRERLSHGEWPSFFA